LYNTVVVIKPVALRLDEKFLRNELQHLEARKRQDVNGSAPRNLQPASERVGKKEV
jgi:hypothetical protein